VLFKKYGIGVKFVTSDDPAAFSAAIDEKTKAVFVESIGNPKYNVSPIREIAKVCKHMFVCFAPVINGPCRSHTIIRSR
jgi:O-acetylhomoserine/O-acetylserine sulfhydrylase-like pyridoxal-dependent enzyme